MGKITDAISEIADQYNALEAAHGDLKRERDKLLETVEALEDRIEEMADALDQYNAMEDYLEEYHPGVVTAFEVVQRMEK